ncbi:MAG: hypothetical protein C5B51_03005 [Terriglobia bacterium]|nr:MAG: hypothetical protein C5B51_03005 [Terriglobia bacterium]
MNQKLGLRLLGEIMRWSDEQARDEFRWLKLMSRFRYDGYEDFRAGARFIERLSVWLQQFKQQDREVAYDFVKKRLVYIGPAEMQLLVERLYTEIVERGLIRVVAEARHLPTYGVWRDPAAVKDLAALKRKTLFMALSDGARIDEFRRANVGILSNEQIVVATQLDGSKWKDLLKKLRKEQGPDAIFEAVYLIDDFIASGTTLLRFDEDEKVWTGKLVRFKATVSEAHATLGGTLAIANSAPIHIHHYVASAFAESIIKQRVSEMRHSSADADWLDRVTFSFGYILPADLPLTIQSTEPFKQLVEAYYDPALESRHSRVSGIESMMYGYRECGLPVVFEHNTPNNSLPLLWAETPGDAAKNIHAMRALFRRRQRHSE